MVSSRLSKQGFVNLHRKPICRMTAFGLLIFLIFVPDLVPFGDTALLAARIGGSMLVFAGIIGRMLATISIGGWKDRAIMKTEAYSVCRNPLYFASFLMTLGIGLVSGRLDFTLLAAVSYLAIFYPMMHNEAAFLRAKFDDFAEYERTVPLFFPNFRLWTERKNFEINFRLVKRTLLDTSIALPLIPILILIQIHWNAGH